MSYFKGKSLNACFILRMMVPKSHICTVIGEEHLSKIAVYTRQKSYTT